MQIAFPAIVSIKMFIELDKASSDYELLKVFIGDLVDSLNEQQAINCIKLADKAKQEVIEWIHNPTKVKLQVLDKEITLPDSIGELPYWPITKVKAIIEKMGDGPFNTYEYYPEMVGHYIYCLVTGRTYMESEAEEFCKEVIQDIDYRIIIQMGDFFLSKHSNVLLQKRTYSLQVLKALRLKLASKFSKSTVI
jgi:hypothetical protein